MICSSLNRLFFISVSFRRSPIQTEGASGGNITGFLLRKTIRTDIATALDLVERTKAKIRDDDTERTFLTCCAEGLHFISEKLACHTKSSKARILTASGYDAAALDSIYRWTLEGAERANLLVKASSPNARYEGIMLTTGCLLIGHLHRLPFIETRTTGPQQRDVRLALTEVQGLVTGLDEFMKASVV